MTANEFVLVRWSGTGYFASKTLHQPPMAKSTIRRFAALLPELQRLAGQLFVEAGAIDATAVAVSTWVFMSLALISQLKLLCILQVHVHWL